MNKCSKNEHPFEHPCLFSFHWQIDQKSMGIVRNISYQVSQQKCSVMIDYCLFQSTEIR